MNHETSLTCMPTPSLDRRSWYSEKEKQLLKHIWGILRRENPSKFGKLSSGHRTGKGQFSFQSQRKAMPQNAQTTAQLHSSHMLVKLFSKFSKPGFSNTWTVNFQSFKLVLEKAEEQKSNCQHLLDHQKSKRVPEKIYIYFLLY